MEKIRILIPTNFTVQAEYAYLMVKNIQSKIPAEVHFLHVLDVPDTVTMDEAGVITTCGDIDAAFVMKQKEIAERNLAGLRSAYGQDIHTHIVAGRPTDSIIGFSSKNNYDLIVIGTKGAWGIKEKLSGSEAQMVARKSSVPVLSLMCDRSDLDIRNILMVHDFNSSAKENLKILHLFMDAFGCRVHFLRITEGDPGAEKEAVLKNMSAFAAANGILSYETHLINGKDVENGVVHFNQMNEMDIICIGTHGKGGLLHSSAAEKLVMHLFKPIITYRLNQQ